MHNRFDQLGKRIGQAALGRSGPTAVNDEISPEVQHADLRHEPDPARAVERARLGLLGRLASSPCLIELYGHAPNVAELRACLLKHLASWQQRARQERSRKERLQRLQPRAAAAPFLWIIAAGTPRTLIAELELTPAPEWPPGVYLLGGNVLRVGLIAANELPRNRKTLLVRLMAAGSLLPHAIQELGALPAGAHERAVATPTLLALQHVLEAKPVRAPEEQEVLVRVKDFFEHLHERGVKQGRAEGRAEGRTKTRAADLLTVLRARGLRVSKAARERILAETDPARLRRWLERAVVAGSVPEIFGDKS